MQQAADLGYDLGARPYAHAPGGGQLDVVLRFIPTGHHFDPEKMLLYIAAEKGAVYRLTISHPWRRGGQPLRACAGRVIVQDRVGKCVEFLTLGGTLTVDANQEQTYCILRSPAPIIELSLSGGVAELLAEEIEDILARRRAHWEGHRGEFERRLAAADPMGLYVACLGFLQDKFNHAPRVGYDEPTVRLIHFMHEEIAALPGNPAQPSTAPALADIL